MILILGALLGLLSVALGAYAEHGLRDVLTDDHFRSLMTALRFHQLYAVVISAIGLALLNGAAHARLVLSWSGALFIIGTLLFSFSIYAAVLFNVPAAVRVAPWGGTLTMMAWLVLMVAGVLMKRKKNVSVDDSSNTELKCATNNKGRE